MGSRYLISGVQLGMLKAFAKIDENEDAKEVIDKIENGQYVGHSYSNLDSDVVQVKLKHNF